MTMFRVIRQAAPRLRSTALLRTYASAAPLTVSSVHFTPDRPDAIAQQAVCRRHTPGRSSTSDHRPDLHPLAIPAQHLRPPAHPLHQGIRLDAHRLVQPGIPRLHGGYRRHCSGPFGSRVHLHPLRAGPAAVARLQRVLERARRGARQGPDRGYSSTRRSGTLEIWRRGGQGVL